jgi:hypothetical protein
MADNVINFPRKSDKDVMTAIRDIAVEHQRVMNDLMIMGYLDEANKIFEASQKLVEIGRMMLGRHTGS